MKGAFWLSWALAGLLAGSLGYHVVQHMENRRIAQELARLSAAAAPAPAPAEAPDRPAVEPLSRPPGMGMECPPRGCGSSSGCPLDRLDLSEDQRAALSASCARAQESENALGAEFRQEVSALHAELQKDEPDRQAIAAIVDRMCRVRRRVLEGKIDAVLEVKGTLTKDQMGRLTEVAGAEKR
ncbi:MAG: periplasmic heavy metal sensor [Planctomycetes bacterium]|nr:periplasmic heavy metal sensor [Planctomycetota bacterium]